MNNVFKCPCCFTSYSKDIHLPISLECGDVFCLPCIQSLLTSSKEISCPIDGKLLQINLNSLTTCKAILDYLPNKTQTKDLFYCKTHPEKRIKYSCDTDSTTFCSLCIASHKKHQISTFYPSRQNISDQMLTLLKATEDKKQRLNEEKELFNQKTNTLNKRLKEQIAYVKHSTDKIVNEVIRQSNEFQLQLKEKYKSQLERLEQFVMENNKYNAFVISIEKDVKAYLEVIKSKTNAIYDEVVGTQRDLLKKWEAFLHNYNISKIDKRKEQIQDEDKVIIDSRLINKERGIFSFKALSLNQNEDDNKENTPAKKHQLIQFFQMSANSTKVNTNSNNYSLNNRTQKENGTKEK